MALGMAASGDAWAGETDEAAAEAEEESEERSDGEPAQGEPSGEKPPPTKSDHDGHAGSVGIGFLGARVVPSTKAAASSPLVITSAGDAILTIDKDDVVVPVFGVRYWFNTTIGLEAGFGFNVAGGSSEQSVASTDPARATTVEGSMPSTAAVVGHLAAPISLYSWRHFGLLAIPELQVGYSSAAIEDYQTSTTGEPLTLRLSGLMVGVGARLGLELSWGFIDLPELSLQVSWGLRYEARRHAGKVGDAEMTVTDNRFGTSWYERPWASFAGSIGVLYYF